MDYLEDFLSEARLCMMCGLPLDRDRVQLSIEGRPYDILVVRVTDPQAGAIWQISSDSLAEVPMLHQAAQAPWIERIMPRPLVTRTLFGVSLARLLGYAASLVLPLAAMWGLSVVFMQVAQRGMRNAARRLTASSLAVESVSELASTRSPAPNASPASWLARFAAWASSSAKRCRRRASSSRPLASSCLAETAVASNWRRSAKAPFSAALLRSITGMVASSSALTLTSSSTEP